MATLQWKRPTYRIVEERGLSIERLHELFALDRETGVLTRRISTSPRARAGDVAGSLNSNGYALVEIARRKYKTHRIVYAMTKGEWPFGQVDHRNGVRSVNRPNNLRNATNTDNGRNRSKHKNNSSGFSGVSWHKRDLKWQARICVNGRVKHLGYFDDKTGATLAVDIARVTHHGEFARLNDPYSPYIAMAEMTRKALGVTDALPILSRIA
jgi:HNH endonuclease